MTTKELSQNQKILTRMCRDTSKEWWFPYDFMEREPAYLFVGYEASARLSELAKSYPDMIDTRQSGKYKQRRLCLDTIDQWFNSLPKELRYVLHRAGLTKDLKTARPAGEAKLLQLPTPPRTTAFELRYKGRTYNPKGYQHGQVYELTVGKLEIGKPVKLLAPYPRTYLNPAAFNKDWAVVNEAS